MTAKYFAILTNQGAARLANAAALGTKLNLTQMAVGDANGVLPTPDPAQTKLINQKRIAPLNLLTVDPANTSQIIAEQIIPENEGGFWIREIGLYDDAGVLIAVANCPETYKPELQEGSGRTQTIRMILIVSSTSAITLKIDPSVVLATRQYVDDKVIEVKSYADGLMRAHEQSRNHPDATTTAKGFTQLNSSVTDDRETQSATPKAVKIAMDNANARLAKERNLADLPNPALARQNLQLGDSSTKNTGTTANTVAAGDDARITGAMQKSQNGADIQDVAKFLQNLGLSQVAIKNEENTFTGDQKFTGGVSLPANTAYKGIGLQAWFDYKQDKDDTLTALSGKDVAGLLLYLGLTSAAKTDAENTFTQKQTFSGSVALPSDTTLNDTGLEYLFDSKLDASKALGTGQTWEDVTASRTSGVTYTNTTTRPICVSIPETADGQRGLYVGGVLTAFARGADSDSTLFAIVPPGAQYIFSGAFSSWAELR
ncbi:TPA: phage tail protein [Salmonella enterica]